MSVLDEGDLDVRAVAQKSAIISLRHSLETLGKWKISYAVSVNTSLKLLYARCANQDTQANDLLC